MASLSLKIKRKYDLVIFGVTSFTGKYLVKEVLKLRREASNSTPKFSWAVAGRSVEKVRLLLQKIGNETGEDLFGQVEIIQADVSDPPSIQAMVKQCQIVVNLVGPYVELGEVVVKACAEEGTHHLDLSGEPLFLGRIEVKYGRIAEMTKCFIVGACGIASVPSDCGAEYLERNFEGHVNSIESFHKCPADDTKMHRLNYGTWHSIVLAMYHFTHLFPLRRKLYRSGNPPSPNYRLPIWPIQYRKEVGSWCLFNPFPDGDVMERSQRIKFQQERVEEEEDQPNKFIQTRSYLQFRSLYRVMLYLMAMCFVGLIAQFKSGVELLKKYPKLFSFRLCSHEGPAEAEASSTKFTFSLVAKGWSEEDYEFAETEQPTKVKILRISGSNPAYGTSAVMVLHAALTILSERDRMPKRGGVYSPGVAFAGTSYIDRLKRCGIAFVLEDE